MIEDKLTKSERIRLEALAQAISTMPTSSSEGIIDRASRFEKFIMDGETPMASSGGGGGSGFPNTGRSAGGS